MKKLVTLICATAMAVASIGMTAMAAPSPSKTVEAADSKTAIVVGEAAKEMWKSEGVSDAVLEVIEKVAASEDTAAVLKEIVGDDSLKDYSLAANVVDVKTADGSKTASFKVGAVAGLSKDNVKVLHFDVNAGKWEVLTPDSVSADGVITVTSPNGWSPVTVAYDAPATSTVPQTGDHSMVAVYAIIAVAAAAAVVLINKKRMA